MRANHCLRQSMADDNKAISMYLEKKGLRTRTHRGDEEARTLISRERKQKGKAINASNKVWGTHSFAFSQILLTFWATRSWGQKYHVFHLISVSQWECSLGISSFSCSSTTFYSHCCSRVAAVVAPQGWWEWENGPYLPGSHTPRSPKVDLRLGSGMDTSVT